MTELTDHRRGEGLWRGGQAGSGGVAVGKEGCCLLGVGVVGVVVASWSHRLKYR